MPDESQPPPVMPSFASLRAPRGRTAMDWLDPEPPPVAAVAPPVPRAPSAPRPPEWSDLLLLGVHLARSLACVPGRLALWSLRHIGVHEPGPGSEPRRQGS